MGPRRQRAQGNVECLAFIPASLAWKPKEACPATAVWKA